MVQAQTVPERTDYSFKGFNGLNLMRDSVDLTPGEAVQLDNFVLDKFGVLHKRYGVVNWNDSLISGGHIKDIHYVEGPDGQKKLYVAADSFVYEQINWEDTNQSWGNHALDYTYGSIYGDTSNGTFRFFSDSAQFIKVAAPGDIINIGDSATYVVDSVLADSCIAVTDSVYTYDEDTTLYRLIKRVGDNPQLSGYAGILYVVDGEHEEWIYGDSGVALMGIMEDGLVTNAPTTDSTMTPFTEGTLQIFQRSNIVILWYGAKASDTLLNGDSAYATGNQIHISYSREGCPHTCTEIRTITGVSGDYQIAISSPFTFWSDCVCGAPRGLYYMVSDTGSFSNWNITRPGNRNTTEQTHYMEDTTAYFPTADGGYSGFWILNGKDAINRALITSNAENIINYDSTKVGFAVDDRYYIVRSYANIDRDIEYVTYGYVNPFGNDPQPVYYDTLKSDLNRFTQIIFHRNRLYAIGYSIAGYGTPDYNLGDTINTNRVWFSDIGIPRFIPPEWNFDISGVGLGTHFTLVSADRAFALFSIKNDLYVATNNNIYRISGEPTFGPEDLYLLQTIQGIGTAQHNGVITTKDYYAYIMNTEGIWRFDGRIIEKISYRIDPLIEQYRNSPMVAGQFKDNIFFSYPDSDVTVVLHEPTQAFTLWDFGMECMNKQFVAKDSNYFLFSTYTDSAYILKYPRDYTTYCDTWDGGSCVNYDVTYRSGWQTFGQPLELKAIDWVGILYNKGAGNLIYNLNVDSLGSVVTISADTMTNTGRRIRKFAPPNDRQGNLFQSHLTAQTAGDITLSEILLTYRTYIIPPIETEDKSLKDFEKAVREAINDISKRLEDGGR
jgi:hypothetical protein